MHDTSLEALCRARPASLSALLAVSGFGERKAAMHGDQVLDAIRRFEKGERAAARIPWKQTKPAMETMRLLAEGRTFQEIANIRGRQVSTVIGTVADLVERGELQFQPGRGEPRRPLANRGSLRAARNRAAENAEGCIASRSHF